MLPTFCFLIRWYNSENELILPEGSYIGPAEIGLLCSVGVTEVHLQNICCLLFFFS